MMKESGDSHVSVRPKVRSGKSEKFDSEPLENRIIKFEDRDGIIRHYPGLHIQFSHTMVFPKYKPPPVKSIADATLMGNSIDDNVEIKKWNANTKVFEESLKVLLKLPHNRFWSTVVHEKCLHIALESYLRYAPRSHDLHNSLITEQMKAAVNAVHLIVFKIYVRMSTFRESKESHISQKQFGVWIYEHFLFDIPKLMDFAVIYGNNNKETLNLIQKMFNNIFMCQPQYLEDLRQSCSNITGAFETIEEKLGAVLLEHRFANNLFKAKSKSTHNSIQWSEIQDILFYITDLAVTIHMMIVAYPPSAKIFHNMRIENTIIEFYERIFPPLQIELMKRFASNENAEILAPMINKQVLLARSKFILIFRNILDKCCINPLIDENISAELKPKIIDELIEMLSNAACEKSFITDYAKQYPFEKDLDDLRQSPVTGFKYIDNERIEYVLSLIQSNCIVKKSKGSESQSTAATVDQNSHDVITIDEYDKPIEEIAIESNIQYLCDILGPDEVGPGFVEQCLKFYNFDNELTLSALLDDNLPPELKALDRHMQRVEKNKMEMSETEKNVQSNQIEENQNVSSVTIVPKVIEERKNIYDGDEFDIFRNKNIDLNRIHRGKREKVLNDNIYTKTKDRIRLLSAMMDEESENIYEYDDEYDDTYEDDTKIDLPNDKLIDEIIDRNRHSHS